MSKDYDAASETRAFIEGMEAERQRIAEAVEKLRTENFNDSSWLPMVAKEEVLAIINQEKDK